MNPHGILGRLRLPLPARSLLRFLAASLIVRAWGKCMRRLQTKLHVFNVGKLQFIVFKLLKYVKSIVIKPIL